MIISDIISYLNSPEPVAKFQKLCGIEQATDENGFGGNREKVVDGLVMGKVFTEKNNIHQPNFSNSSDDEMDLFLEEIDKYLGNGGAYMGNGNEILSGERNFHQNTAADENKERPEPKIRINNLFFYYLFMFGAKLGEEIFYISFFPFWFWNVDGFVGRRLCVFWAAFMYLGQASKDLFKIPRPSSPPVVRLESKYNKEFGMPSTHAMVGAGLPFAIYFLTKDRYIFPSELTLLIALAWCSVVCFSRIYLGMHSILDVLAGLLFVFTLMAISFRLNLLDVVDAYVLKGGYVSLFVSVFVPLFLCFYYPSPHENWSSARSDTFIILAVCSGSLVAHWLNFNLGHMKRPIGELGFCGSASTAESIFFPASSIHCNPQYLSHRHIHHRSHRHHHRSSDGSSLSQLVALQPPYPVPELTLTWLVVSISRTILGVVVLVTMRVLVKYSVKAALGLFYSQKPRYKNASSELLLPELIQKYLTYSSITIIGLSFCPLLFGWLNIERETYFTEL